MRSRTITRRFLSNSRKWPRRASVSLPKLPLISGSTDEAGPAVAVVAVRATETSRKRACGKFHQLLDRTCRSASAKHLRSQGSCQMRPHQSPGTTLGFQIQKRCHGFLPDRRRLHLDHLTLNIILDLTKITKPNKCNGYLPRQLNRRADKWVPCAETCRLGDVLCLGAAAAQIPVRLAISSTTPSTDACSTISSRRNTASLISSATLLRLVSFSTSS